MEKDSKITVLYRLAEKSNKTNKNKPDYINNENCFRNFYVNRGDSKIIVFGDRLTETEKLIKNYYPIVRYEQTKSHGNCPTFLEVVNYALKLPDEEIVYFVEDDYLHRGNWCDVMREGLQKMDFVSLYDHPDKYEYEDRNKLFVTKNSHWKITNSTTMTFACKVKTLKFVADIFPLYCVGVTPNDFQMWNHFRELGYVLATTIPGLATHGEIQWLSPIYDWASEV